MNRRLTYGFVVPAAFISLTAAVIGSLFHYQASGDLNRLWVFYLQFAMDRSAAWLALGLICMSPLIARRVGWQTESIIVWLDRNPRTIVVAASVCYTLGALLLYRGYAFSGDEYAMLFQAKVFAAGKLTGRFPVDLLDRLLPVHRDWFFIASPLTGEVSVTYWPGFSLLLTPFVWVRAPWLLNPILGGASLGMIWLIAKRLYPDSQAGGWALALTLGSPAFNLNAVSYYSMAAHLFLNLCFAALLLTPTPRRAFCAGVIGSFALILHNPLPHTLFAVPWIAALLLNRDSRRSAISLLVGYVPLAMIIGVGWLLWRIAFIESIPSAVVLGGGASGYAAEVTRAAFGLPDTGTLRLRILQLLKLATWAFPGLLILALHGWYNERQRGLIRVFATSAMCTFVGYLLVRVDQGYGWGYRYFHATWMVLPILAAGYLAVHAPSIMRRVAMLIAIASVFVLNAVASLQVGALISERFAMIPTPPGDRHLIVVTDPAYQWDLIQNDPFLRSPRIVLRGDGSAADSAFISARFQGARLSHRHGITEVWEFGGLE